MILPILIIILAFLSINQNLFAAKKLAPITDQTKNIPLAIPKFIPFAPEVRGVWFSFIDWEKMPSEKKAFEQEVDAVMNKCLELGLNTIFVHARSHSDAMYQSNLYPWSRFITGTQGQYPGYDPYKIFIDAAHKRGISFHAWVNPYRVTGHLNKWEQVCGRNPAKTYMQHNSRWVLKNKNEYYMNPAIREVRVLIVEGVKEIVERYNVDGIHFDDYFYPELEDAKAGKCFDYKEYQLSKSNLSLEEWRKNNVNQLIKEVYETIKRAKPNVYFGISPFGYITKLKSNYCYFTDIDTWLTQPGYIDYIIPQLYWGFETKTSKGQPAPYAFSQVLNDWIALKKNSKVNLYLGLALYKTCRDTKDNNKKSEWLRHNDIMKRQIEAGRATGLVSGYVFFAYNSFQDKTSNPEIKNIVSVFKKK